MKVQVLSGAIPETFNILFQEVATNPFMLLQTLAVKSFLNKR